MLKLPELVKSVSVLTLVLNIYSNFATFDITELRIGSVGYSFYSYKGASEVRNNILTDEIPEDNLG